MSYNIREVFAPRLFSCLRGYSLSRFSSDAMAGLIVGVVAIPLAIAFGIASGVGPTEGLVTAIIAGFIISAFGGTKVQIGGPTGAFIIIIYGIIQQHGLAGLMIATIMAGIMLIAMGLARFGSIIKFVPYPVIVGFTGGIAITIFSTQMNDFFGLGIENVPAGFIEKWGCYFANITHINYAALAVGALSLAIIILTPKISKRIPGSLMAIVIVTLACWGVKMSGCELGVQTIGDLYALPHGIPAPTMPELDLAEGMSVLDLVRSLLPAAFTIAMLGAIESLLSAMVADGVISDRHNSNTELIAQGMANVVVPFFGGIPATGAIARTMANINNGGRTPVAGIIHALVLLLVLLFMGPLVGLIPMPCLAAVLIMVAYNMSGWRTFVAMAHNPKADFAVLIVTFLLTVIFDLTIAIEVGLLLAIVLFLKRTSESVHITQFKNSIDPNLESDMDLTHEETLVVPDRVEVYEIDGPYFFGIANRMDELISRGRNTPRVRIIRMRRVPFMDSTGLHNLELLVGTSHRQGISVVLSGVKPEVHRTLINAGFDRIMHSRNICPNINVALERAKELVREAPEYKAK